MPTTVAGRFPKLGDHSHNCDGTVNLLVYLSGKVAGTHYREFGLS